MEERYDPVEWKYDRMEWKYDRMEEKYDPVEWKYDRMEWEYDRMEERDDPNGTRIRSNGKQVAIRLHFCPECPSIQFSCAPKLAKSMRLNIVRNLVKQLTGQRTASK